MKVNINLCTKQEARLTFGVIFFAVIDLLFFNLFTIKSAGLILACCFGISFQAWLIFQFSQQAPQDIFAIDLRTEFEKEEEREEQILDLIEGKKNHLMMQVLEGQISKEQYDEKLQSINDILNNNQKFIT